MSIILDALRKVERERPPLRRAADAERRALGNTAVETPGFFHGRYMGFLAAGGLLAFTGGFCFAAGMAGRNPLHPLAAEAMTRNEPAVTVSTAIESGDVARHGGEEEARNGSQLSAHEESHGIAANPKEEQGAGPRGVAGEASPRKTAGPILSATHNRIEPRGTEPPVRLGAQAAPAPVFLLDGIVYHDDPDKRTALLRVRGGESALLGIGESLRGYQVGAIGQSRVALAAAGGKKIELALD